jgi:hypothetical protein
MPANSFSGNRIVSVTVRALASYGYAQTDGLAQVSGVPGGGVGTTLELPSSPGSGDWYAFADEDGSCGPSAPIVLEATGGATVAGGATFSSSTPRCAGLAIYCAAAGNWAVFSSSPGSSGPNLYWDQATWVIDPKDSTGLASDSNTGLTALSPLKSWNGGVVARWGTIAPTLAQNTTIEWLSPHTDDSDPVLFTPTTKEGATVIMSGAFTAANLIASGVFGTVTPVNKALGVAQALEIVMPTAASLYGAILVNTTKGATSTFVRLVSGTTWIVSAPLLEQSMPPASILYTESSATTGDSFAAYAPTAVNLVYVKPTVSTLNASSTNPLYLYRLKSFDPSGTDGTNLFHYAGDMILVDFVHGRRPQANVDGVSLIQRMVNNYFPVGLMTDLRIPSTLSPNAQHSLQGGCVGGPSCVSSGLYNCCLLSDVALAAHSGVLDVVACQYGTVYIDAGVTVNLATGRHEQKTGFTNQWWGPGTLNVDGNSILFYPAGAGAAAATFTQTGWELNKGASAWASDSTSFYSVVLTSAALDAAAGAAGFGGAAFNVGGASISNGTFPTLPTI